MKPNSSKRYNGNNSRSTYTGTKGGDRKPIEKSVDKHEPVQAQPLQVIIRGGENFERALRAFRSLVQKERIISDFKEKRHFEKPSDKKRRKINESKRNQLEACSKGECKHTEHAENKRTRKPRE